MNPSSVASANACSKDSIASCSRPASSSARARSRASVDGHDRHRPEPRQHRRRRVGGSERGVRVAGEHMDLDETDERVEDVVVRRQVAEAGERRRLEIERARPCRPATRRPATARWWCHLAVRVVRCPRHSDGVPQQLFGRIETELQGEDLGEVVVRHAPRRRRRRPARSTPNWPESRRSRRSTRHSRHALTPRLRSRLPRPSESSSSVSSCIAACSCSPVRGVRDSCSTTPTAGGPGRGGEVVEPIGSRRAAPSRCAGTPSSRRGSCARWPGRGADRSPPIQSGWALQRPGGHEQRGAVPAELLEHPGAIDGDPGPFVAGRQLAGRRRGRRARPPGVPLARPRWRARVALEHRSAAAAPVVASAATTVGQQLLGDLHRAACDGRLGGQAVPLDDQRPASRRRWRGRRASRRDRRAGRSRPTPRSPRTRDGAAPAGAGRTALRRRRPAPCRG